MVQWFNGSMSGIFRILRVRRLRGHLREMVNSGGNRSVRPGADVLRGEHRDAACRAGTHDQVVAFAGCAVWQFEILRVRRLRSHLVKGGKSMK